MARWMLAALAWMAGLVLAAWFLLPDEVNGAYILFVLIAVGSSVPISSGLVREFQRRQRSYS